MNAHAKTLLVAALLTGCQTVHSVLPQDPITISVEQRGRAAIPGSTQSLFVCLGDITRGQMMLSLENKKGDTIVDARSVRYGDIVAFELGELLECPSPDIAREVEKRKGKTSYFLYNSVA